jgi:hypothetical protein
MGTMRSPNYPALSLRECCQRTRLLWTKEKRTPVPADVAAKAIGYAGVSGPSRTALASMKKYGLVDSDDKTVRVSDLALRLIHPPGEQEEIKALQEAALKPELFASLYSTHQNASDDALRSYLITRLDFSESGARQVIKAFRDTMNVAQLDEPDSKPLIELSSSDSLQMNDNKHVELRYVPDRTAFDAHMTRLASAEQPSKTLTVPVGPDVYAEVRIRGGGGELRSEYIDALCQYLLLAKRLVTPTEPRKESGDNQQS